MTLLLAKSLAVLYFFLKFYLLLYMLSLPTFCLTKALVSKPLLSNHSLPLNIPTNWETVLNLFFNMIYKVSKQNGNWNFTTCLYYTASSLLQGMIHASLSCFFLCCKLREESRDNKTTYLMLTALSIARARGGSCLWW